ncbi:MAG: hypothetical protein AB4352_10735 [Hormoscilla sp.]
MIGSGIHRRSSDCSFPDRPPVVATPDRRENRRTSGKTGGSADQEISDS